MLFAHIVSANIFLNSQNSKSCVIQIIAFKNSVQI